MSDMWKGSKKSLGFTWISTENLTAFLAVEDLHYRVEKFSIDAELITPEFLDPPRELDPDWRFVDDKGHLHSFDTIGITLKEQIIGSWYCEEHDEVHEEYGYLCASCGQEIEPGKRPGKVHPIIGPLTVTIKTDGRPPEPFDSQERFLGVLRVAGAEYLVKVYPSGVVVTNGISSTYWNGVVDERAYSQSTQS